jgi:hypothetical protein
MRDNQGNNTMRDPTFSRRDLLWAGGALTVGAAFAEPLQAAAAEPSGAVPEPTSWVDSAMPEVTHRIIETSGIRTHVAEQGTGPLVILLFLAIMDIRARSISFASRPRRPPSLHLLISTRRPRRESQLWLSGSARSVPSEPPPLAGAGFKIHSATNLTAEWGPILKERLAMHPRLREEARQAGTPMGHDAFHQSYISFVELIQQRKLGGVRIVASK